MKYMKTKLFQQFEDIPCFTKSDLRLVFDGSEKALDGRIERAIKNKIIIPLKKGFYVSYLYWLKEPDKTVFSEFIASKLRYPSYLSLAYILAKNNILTEAVYAITSITVKTKRSYQNQIGSFLYSSIKTELFVGYEQKTYRENNYFTATLAKALFDWFYLRKNLGVDLKEEILEGLRINWENFSLSDFQEFKKYVELSKSNKMAKIAQILAKEVYHVNG